MSERRDHLITNDLEGHKKPLQEFIYLISQ